MTLLKVIPTEKLVPSWYIALFWQILEALIGGTQMKENHWSCILLWPFLYHLSLLAVHHDMRGSPMPSLHEVLSPLRPGAKLILLPKDKLLRYWVTVTISLLHKFRGKSANQ